MKKKSKNSKYNIYPEIALLAITLIIFFGVMIFDTPALGTMIGVTIGYSLCVFGVIYIMWIKFHMIRHISISEQTGNLIFTSEPQNQVVFDIKIADIQQIYIDPKVTSGNFLILTERMLFVTDGDLIDDFDVFKKFQIQIVKASLPDEIAAKYDEEGKFEYVS